MNNPNGSTAPVTHSALSHLAALAVSLDDDNQIEVTCYSCPATGSIDDMSLCSTCKEFYCDACSHKPNPCACKASLSQGEAAWLHAEIERLTSI